MRFDFIRDVTSPDRTTLFCTSGMQRFKERFADTGYRDTFSNIQSCFRLTDLDEVGDGTHGVSFDMMGLFSFREWTVPQTIDFWFDFLDFVGIVPDVVTIHPERPEWRSFYEGRSVEVRFDEECVWSDGEQGGFCTEFYKDGVEIGNIVNTGGDCIDVGFGLQRLMLALGEPPRSRIDELQSGVSALIDSGVRPSGKAHGYVLRKLLRELHRLGSDFNHEFFSEEVKRQERLKLLYERLRDKHRDKTPEWWMDTHGIDVDEINSGAGPH